MERDSERQRYDGYSVLRERIAVLETKFAALQEAIDALGRGQSANRGFTEQSFNDVMGKLGEMRTEISDLKMTVAARSFIHSPQEDFTRRWLIGLGLAFGLLVIVLMALAVLLWFHPWTF